MTLEIIKTPSRYYLKGQINETSKTDFITYFFNRSKDEDNIRINIEDVNQIDRKGLQAIFFLLERAKIYNKKFIVEGYGCKDIYDQYYQKSVA